jgi:exopolysaccharide biosynthesis polyprenyl glycosylphosphotransferase
LVEDVSACADAPPRRVLVEGGDHLSRAASGAARGQRSGPSGDRSGARAARRRRPAVASLITLDLLIVALASGFAWAAWAQPGGTATEAAAAIVLPAAWVAAAALHHGYDRHVLGNGPDELRRLARAFATLVAVLGAVAYAGDLDISRGYLAGALLSALLLEVPTRLIMRRRLAVRRRAGVATDRVLLVGRAASLPAVVATLRREPAAGLQVIGACVPDDEANDPALCEALTDLGVPVLGAVPAVPAAIDRHGADSVAVVAGDLSPTEVRALAWSLDGTGAGLIVTAGLVETAGERLRVQTVAGTPLLRVALPRFRGIRHGLKGGFDRAVAALALVVLSPVLLAIAALVRCTSRGPALYRQERVGRDGRPFRMVKFRSMHVGADRRLAELANRNDMAQGPLFKMREDPRVTRVGKWLRRFSLDELPQLLNVLAGSMSLVGPRPPLPSEVAAYDGVVRRRLLVKPGLTGLWQVSGRSDLGWEDAVRLDLHYVDNWSFGLDVRLLARTVRAVVRAEGAY